MQVINRDYLEQLESKLDAETFQKFKERAVIVSNANKPSDDDAIMEFARERLGFDAQKMISNFHSFYNLGDGDQAKAENEKVLTSIRRSMKILSADFEAEFAQRKTELQLE